MQLNDKNLLELSQLAISAALEAGKIIKQFTGKKLTIDLKSGTNNLAAQVVTEVDNLSQTAIVKILQPSCDKFDLALLAEESEDDKLRLTRDYFWCIDPLDGTLPFVESLSGYSVAIALVAKSGVPIIGVIYDPTENTIYHAIKGQGLLRNNLPWSPPKSTNTNLETLTLIIDRSFIKHENYTQAITALESIGYKKLNIIQHGGAAMNACWVLNYAPACYFKFPKQQCGGGSLWDFSATACLFNETEAIVSDIYGDTLDLNRHDSTFMNHKGVIYATEQSLADKIMTIFKAI